MRILVYNYFAIDRYYFINSRNKFFEIYNKFDVIIVNFDFIEDISFIKNYFKGKIFFIYSFVDELIYKKSLELGDEFFLYEESWKIRYKIEKFKKELNIKSDIFKNSNFIYNFKLKKLFINNENVILTKGENDVLEILIRNNNRFLNKLEIIELSELIDSLDSLKVIISNLRKKGVKIENKKNLGYKLKE